MTDDEMPPEGQTALRNAIVGARNAEAESLPYPPNGLTPIPSRAGAKVLGYVVKPQRLFETFLHDRLVKPGDPGFRDFHMARLSGDPTPDGWEHKGRTAVMLSAIVEGNPILLEDEAKSLGYPSALATHPNLLRLQEILS